MDIFIDHEPMPLSGEPPATLGELIEQARGRVMESGRLIVEVRLDGEPVGEERFEEAMGRAIEAEEVQLVTADARELTRQTLDDVKQSLGSAREAQQEAAQSLSADEPSAALERVREALQVWGHAQSAVQQVAQLFQLPLDEMTVGGRSLHAVAEELAEQLNQVREQLAANDWLGLADTLGHELDRTVDTWSELMDVLMSEVQQRKIT